MTTTTFDRGSSNIAFRSGTTESYFPFPSVDVGTTFLLLSRRRDSDRLGHKDKTKLFDGLENQIVCRSSRFVPIQKKKTFSERAFRARITRHVRRPRYLTVFAPIWPFPRPFYRTIKPVKRRRRVFGTPSATVGLPRAESRSPIVDHRPVSNDRTP